jgi:hypothetical protein
MDGSEATSRAGVSSKHGAADNRQLRSIGTQNLYKVNLWRTPNAVQPLEFAEVSSKWFRGTIRGTLLQHGCYETKPCSLVLGSLSVACVCVCTWQQAICTRECGLVLTRCRQKPVTELTNMESHTLQLPAAEVSSQVKEFPKFYATVRKGTCYRTLSWTSWTQPTCPTQIV